MKRLPKRHFPQYIKRTHLIPFCHIDAVRPRMPLFTNDPNELIYYSTDDGFLIKKGTLREGRGEHFAHRAVLMRVALATDATSTKPGTENVVEGGFDGHWLIWSRVPVYCLP